MVNKQYFPNHPVPVDSIIEVRLCFDTWDKIKRISRREGVSFSWVVRYALFRMVNRKNINVWLGLPFNRAIIQGFSLNDLYYELHQKTRLRRFDSVNKHRHRLCLYGEDELFIRLVAARLNCTMTHLVRLALERYLDSILEFGSWGRVSLKRFPGKNFSARESFRYWLGIKLYADVEFHTSLPPNQSLQFKPFKRDEYF